MLLSEAWVFPWQLWYAVVVTLQVFPRLSRLSMRWSGPDGCLVPLVSNTKVNLSQPLSPQLVCNQSNHSVIKMTNQFLQCRQSVFMGCAGQQLTRLSSITYTISYSLPNITWNLPDQAISWPVHVKLTNGRGNIACDSLTCHYCHKKRIKTPSLHRCSSTPSCPCKHGIATHHRLNRKQCHKGWCNWKA